MPKPAIKKALRNNENSLNLNPSLNEDRWYDNYSGPTVEALTEEQKDKIQEIEDKLHALYEEAVTIFPFYSPEL